MLYAPGFDARAVVLSANSRFLTSFGMTKTLGGVWQV